MDGKGDGGGGSSKRIKRRHYITYLIQAGLLLEACRADGVEEAQDAHSVGLRRVLGHLEGHLHVGHRAEVVDLVRLNLFYDAKERKRKRRRRRVFLLSLFFALC